MFFVVTRKKLLSITTIILLIIALTSIFCSGTINTTASPTAKRKVPIYQVKTEEKKVAITFDAAWGADKTEKIMQLLQQYNAGGTFFLVGFWVDKYPDLVKEIDKNGFDIGNHSKNHLNMPKLSTDKINEEIAYVNDAVNKLTNKKPKFFRAPFGDYNNSVIEEVEKNGNIPIQWSVDSLDWKGIEAREIANRVLKNVKNGSIILCHNNSDHILEALPIILLELQNKGYKMVNLSELVYKDNYIIDNNGIQIQNGGTNGLRTNEQQ